ncbi:putative metal-binding protein [Adhaeribacter soli]|uniref:DUF2604 domain-containing protein n=1 Tax=Adhaeribacter soli TaxID=2607655 RepID=A0A5N1IZU8_9BACT|nr:putative metal-binding protein [Adhaeribacter soli]KAA9338986.1 DUF2604 domain-containing protein [Adhaeribacter soli]
MSKDNEKKDEKPNGNNGKKNQLTVQVRYQADTVTVETNVNASITSLLEKALIETQNNSVPKERFQLKLDGAVLDPHKKVNDYPIVDGSLLVLTLMAGGGGTKAICYSNEMDAVNIQFVDSEVTQQKFSEELAVFVQLKEEYRKKGILLLEQRYPDLFFAFVAPSLFPMPIAFAVRINFINYDVQPLSVKFVHPLTLEPVTNDQIPSRLRRKLEGSTQSQDLLQADSDQIPFFCIPGVREYHEHPYHNGDSWFLYRKKGGEGSLCFILDNLHLYGTSHLTSYLVQFNVHMQMPALGLSSNPQDLPL